MSDYDWAYIRQRYERGENPNQISKALGGRPTKQGIAKHAAKEGWEQQEASELPDRCPIVAKSLHIDSRKLTDDLLQTMLGLIQRGSSETLACQAVGIAPSTWAKWKHDAPQLKDIVQRARAGKLSEWIGRIDRASEKDWKAAQALLQAQPETREHYGKGHEGGSKLEIVIHIEREAVRGDQPRAVYEHGEPA